MITRLAELLAGPDVTIDPIDAAVIEVRGLDSERIGSIAAANGIVLHELTPQQASLEEAFMELTRDSLEFHADGTPNAEREGALA